MWHEDAILGFGKNTTISPVNLRHVAYIRLSFIICNAECLARKPPVSFKYHSAPTAFPMRGRHFIQRFAFAAGYYVLSGG